MSIRSVWKAATRNTERFADLRNRQQLTPLERIAASSHRPSPVPPGQPSGVPGIAFIMVGFVEDVRRALLWIVSGPWGRAAVHEIEEGLLEAFADRLRSPTAKQVEQPQCPLPGRAEQHRQVEPVRGLAEHEPGQRRRIIDAIDPSVTDPRLPLGDQDGRQPEIEVARDIDGGARRGIAGIGRSNPAAQGGVFP